MRPSSLSSLTKGFAKRLIRLPLIYLFHLCLALHMMLSLSQFAPRRATSSTVHVRYLITKMEQSLFPEEKLPVVRV